MYDSTFASSSDNIYPYPGDLSKGNDDRIFFGPRPFHYFGRPPFFHRPFFGFGAPFFFPHPRPFPYYPPYHQFPYPYFPY